MASQWHPTENDIEPSDVTAFSGKKVWWVCERGHSWQAKVKNRTKNGTGCPGCSKHHATRGDIHVG